MKYLILSLCFNVVSSILTVPDENNSVKMCVQKIIKNAVPFDTTVLYVDYKAFENFLPDKMQNPYLTYDTGKTSYTISGYRSYNEMIIMNIRGANCVKYYLYKMRKHVWKLETSAKRRYLIIVPSQKVSELKEIFLYFFELHVDDVIVITYNFTLKKEAIKVFTWNPYHPSNKCGTIFNIKEEESCSSVKMIENPRKLKNFNKCNMTYWYDNGRRYDRYCTEVAYVTRFFLDLIGKTLNFTIVPSTGRQKITGLYMYVRRLDKCSKMSKCTNPFLRNGYIWTVPPPKRINPMVVFKIVYKPIVWILILLTFLSISVIWWFISYCRHSTNFAYVLLNVYSLTLFGFINKIPMGLPLRMIFIAYVIYAIHIQSIFVSNLVKMLTIPQYEHGINNLEELAASDLPILIDDFDTATFRAKEPNNSLYTKVTSKFHIVPYSVTIDALRNETALEHNSVFVIFDVLYQIVQYYKPKLHIIVESELVGMEQRAYTTTDGSPFLHILNNIVSIFLESGLINLKQIYIMDVDCNEIYPIKSEVIVKETFSYHGKYEDNENEELKTEPIDFEVKSEDDLVKHMDIHTVSIHQYVCSECSFSTTEKGFTTTRGCSIKEHSRIHTKICNCNTPQTFSLTPHLKTSKNGNECICSEYDYKRPWKLAFKERVNIHTDKEYKCEECNYKTPWKQNLKVHLKIHTGDEYRCKECEYKTHWKHRLKEHVKIHTGDEYKCDECDYKTPWKQNLKAHVKIHIGDVYKCKQCNYTTQWKHYFKEHEKIHNGKEYKCEKCNYKTPWKQNLKAHVKIHTSDEYRCKECDYRTNWKQRLKEHVKIHTGDEYKCEECEYKTPWKQNLKEHVNIHTGVEYKCKDCDYKTRWKHSLKEHVNIHTGDEYKCNKCDYKTLWKRSLKVHMKIHTDN
ncbi:hypothetical protein FQA39_LY10632 [Lamprigera yunnana]|nr:hypothetical protein FQA39_LY10632 [Lamprigera yunnana]